jgi:Family of unknown function (DUF6186)
VTWRAVTLAGWAVLAAAVLAVEAAAIVTGRLPTAGDVVGSVVRRRAGRWLVLVGWLWLGWHVFVR